MTGLNAPLLFRPFPGSLWNQRADYLPVDPYSDAIVKAIGNVGLAVDAEVPYLVTHRQKMVPVTVGVGDNDPVYIEASDWAVGNVCKAPFPLEPSWTQKGFNPNAQDYHGIVVDLDRGFSYEAEGLNLVNGQWQALTLAVWNLHKNDDLQRPATWPASCGGGCSWMGGLVTYDEAVRDEINHALMFTLAPASFPYGDDAWATPPCYHPLQADAPNDPNLACGVGTRFVLRPDFDDSQLPVICQAFTNALKVYGMILTDRGGPMRIAATGDTRWPSLSALSAVKATDFRVLVRQPRYTYSNYPK